VVGLRLRLDFKFVFEGLFLINLVFFGFFAVKRNFYYTGVSSVSWEEEKSRLAARAAGPSPPPGHYTQASD
jgi:hypothetical protein